MLAALLLTGLVTAPLSSLALFVPSRNTRGDGWWAFSRRLTSALAATVLLAAAAYGISVAAGTDQRRAVVAAISFALCSALLLPITRRWSGRAHACWVSCTYLYLAYLAFIIDWTFHSGLSAGGMTGGVILWVLELIAGIFAAAYLWELCDALGTEQWRRRISSPEPARHSVEATYLPFVSLHVPAHNEPPDMVIETLESLRQMDYPSESYEIVAIDDNTDDPALWHPVRDWCAGNGVAFAHLEDWPGYKSGALNYALQTLTDPRAEVIGVVDSDYQITPGFLRACGPLFADPTIGFIQAPQDYRDWEQASYYRRLYYSYKYFFAVSQPSRNEHDAAIFAGTMGLIRRAVLEELGGWDEWCITEDAELSLRLLRAGWSGLHVDQSYGHGVMPLTFEALKGQRYRWCFGGIQILRMYWRSLLPGRRDDRNRLSLGQRWGYLAGGLQWYGDLLGLIFYIFLLVGAVNLALGGGQLFRTLTGFLVAAVPALVLLGLVRAVALLRRGTGASWRDAFGAFFIWQATSLVVARASVAGLFAKQAVFMRTPKTFDHAGWRQVFRANRGESVLAALGLLGFAVALAHVATLSGVLLAVLLIVPTLGYASAPLNSLAAQRAALPPELSRRRRTEFLRAGTVAKGAIGFSGLAVAGASAAVILALVGSSDQPQHLPKIVAAPPPRRSHSPSPAGSSTSPGSSSTSSASPGTSSSAATSVAASPSSPTATDSTVISSPVTSPATSPSATSPAASSPTAVGSTPAESSGSTLPAAANETTPASPSPTPTPGPTSSATSSSASG
ncbi:MAG TPA: glycosyltransferase family 2 protein [Jatrophihabitans sp.]